MLRSIDYPENDTSVQRLRALVDEGNYGPGDRLPPERQLIEMLGIGRGALRRALDQLESDGLIWRHVGKGTFVARESDRPNDVLSTLAHQMNPVRMMRARLCIEPAIAREAAINASGEALSAISAAIDGARAAASWSEYERQDDKFHRAVAEASDNPLLIAVFDDVVRVKRKVAWGSVTRENSRPPLHHSSFAEHDAIYEAIVEHDPEAAFQEMRKHLNSVSARLFGDS